MNTLEGQIAIVTGASAGIGAATARLLVKAGATVVVVARRADRLTALVDELGGDSIAFPADLADPSAPQALLDFVTERFGRTDILINNAGILRAGPVESFDLDELGPMIAINYDSIVRSSALFSRAMKTAGGGQIVNVSSIGAHVTAAGTGIYSGLKKALEIFTDTLRMEMAGTGVRVGLIAPGTTSTEIFDDMKRRGEPGWDSYIPALVADDIARAVRFMVEQPAHANVARVHIYSASEVF